MTPSFQKNFRRLSQSLIVIGLFVTGGAYVLATTPNPGHPWDEVGDGTFAVTGPSIARTYTFPDANATVLTSNAAVTLAQGGTSKALTADNGGIIYTDADSMEVLAGTATAGQILRSGASSAPSWSTATYPATVTQGDILYASATNVISSLAKDTNSTRYLSNTGASNAPAWAQVDVSNGVTGQLPLTNGGTAASLTASNGGIFYSTGTAGAILSGTATANQVLLSGASTTPAWSTATYPSTAGTAGNQLMSNGTNFTSADIIPDLQYSGGAINNFFYATASTSTATTTSNATLYTYVGKAKKAYSSCDVRTKVLTAYAGTVTWAELGMFSGTIPSFGQSASLTLLGATSVVGTFNTLGTYTVTVSLSGVSQGDDLWVAIGSQTNGGGAARYRVLAGLANDLNSGMVQVKTSSGAISTQATVSPSASTTNPGWFYVYCT